MKKYTHNRYLINLSFIAILIIGISTVLLLSNLRKPQTTSSHAATNLGCQFLKADQPTNIAFCDDFSEGANAGGREGDLDNSRWSVTRLVGQGSGGGNYMTFPTTPASACKTGMNNVTADNDILVCDSASGHQGQIETAFSAQNYGELSLRPRQLFDFTNRTGTITFNVDAFTDEGLSWWPSLYVTDEPSAGAANQEQVVGVIPHNGVGMNFNDDCTTPGTQVKVDDVYVYNNYTETEVPLTNTVCVQTKRGSLNHFEVRVSQSNIQLWGSDYSSDGQTYPNFRLMGSAPISLNFSKGYVHFQAEERAPEKYTSEFSITPTYTNYYWSNLGFDGPVSTTETGYTVPDSLTVDPNPANSSVGYTSSGQYLNVGYGLLDNGMTTSCCSTGGNTTIVAPFSLSNVNLQGITSAKLTFSVDYTWSDPFTPTTAGLQYRFNGGTWRTPSPFPDLAAATYCTSCPSPPGNANVNVAYSFPVVLSDLQQGTNTLSFQTSGTLDGYPPILANVDLLTFTGTSPVTPTPTSVVATLTPTRTPTPTASPTPRPTNTPTPSPILDPIPTKLSLTIGLDGIGKAGDNVNRGTTGNTSPQHPTRTVTLNLSDQNNNPLPTVTGTVTYDSTSGLFKGTIALPATVTTGFYTLKVSSPSFLQKAVPAIISITAGQTATVPTTYLTAGDINNDNQISLTDYNLFLGCFGSTASTCSSSDLDDDGTVGGSDYNLFLRELSVQNSG